MRKGWWGSNNISEVDVWVGKLGSCKSVHSSIISGNLEESEKHLDWVVIGSVFDFEFLVISEENINDNVLFLVAQSFTSVNSREDVNVPNCSSVNVWWAEYLSRWVIANCWQWSEHHINQVWSGLELVFVEVNVVTLQQVYNSDIERSLNFCVSKFFLQEAL